MPTNSDLVSVASEPARRGARADWQLQALANIMHAFMAPQANSREPADPVRRTLPERSWSGLERFLAECLAAPSKS
ncbi:hypothetical protein FDZ84_32800 [Saccharopolyspora sp. ASAGF58]|nr:hypothetical protein FDZ84_32800 [Saccharopolyspora sp. ASAGF58]